jgi:hypothetical protein
MDSAGKLLRVGKKDDKIQKSLSVPVCFPFEVL